MTLGKERKKHLNSVTVMQKPSIPELKLKNNCSHT